MLTSVTPVFRLTAFAGLAAAATVSFAGPPPGERWSDHAWRGSSDYRSVARPAPAAQPVYPERSTIQVRVLPYAYAPAAVVAGGPAAHIVAHLPPGADLYVGEVKMVSDASRPAYDITAPALVKGEAYTFGVRVQWFEDGKWVTQSHSFPLHTGDTHCIEVVPVDAPVVARDVAASMAKMPEADRKAALAQQTCAVQDTVRLGSMGPPVKVAVGGKDIYLCCEGCRATALSDPAKTTSVAQANEAKAAKAGEKK